MADVIDRGPDDPRLALRILGEGFQVAQGISVAARLGIADLLADGVRSSEELAALASADPDALYRLLRALATVGVLAEEDGRRFSLTAIGDGLRTDAEGSLAGWLAFICSPPLWEAWGHLEHSVRTGANAFQHIHGEDVWTYRSKDPAASVMFDRAMASLSHQQRQAVAVYDFAPFATIADIGGGTGSFLARILTTVPDARGILFDLPHVVAGAPAVLAAAGVEDRCEVVGGSFFDGVPAGADAYVLRAVVHDWDDEDAVRILRSCRDAIAAAGALLVVERELGAPNENADAKLSDLNMMIGPGGRERTREQFAALLAAGGFALA